MLEENLPKRIGELKVWTDIQKHYIINHLYFEKINDYFLKEYGGEILSKPTLYSEYCSSFDNSEEYRSNLYFNVHFKQKYYTNKEYEECISFYVEYHYAIYKKDNSLWEEFNAYRKSDNVYLQGVGEGEYPKEYRSEYNRAWQEGGLRKIYVSPEETN